MMHPDYVLPIFLGLCLAGVCIWNVRLTGEVEKSESRYEDLAVAHSDLFDENEGLKEQYKLLVAENEKVKAARNKHIQRAEDLATKNERLLDDITKLAAGTLKRDEKGRFRKRC
jgi:hypothetical protein